jgi:hypothetical protein
MMIAITEKPRPYATQHTNDRFLEMLPRIQRQAGVAFRQLPTELQQEFVQEVIANAYCAFATLVSRGKANIAFATPLTNFAIRQVLAGRRVGTRSGLRDVTSPRARAAGVIVLRRLDVFDSRQGRWRETLVEDRRAGPAEIAAARLDVAAWLQLLPRRKRRIALALAAGETTGQAAQRFQLSPARISQLRKELEASWRAFQGETPPAGACPTGLANAESARRPRVLG